MIDSRMPTVYIPSMLRPLADGCEIVHTSGSTVREVADDLTARFPALRSRLLDGEQLRRSISVAIDGEVSTLGMLDDVEEDSEVHFVPAISGGRDRARTSSLG